jgi:hypothetical protein
VVAFDADALAANPAAIAGSEQPSTEDTRSPACEAAVSAFRTALMFRQIFTAVVALLAVATVLLLIWFLWRIGEGFDTGTGIALAGTLVTGTASGFLGKRMLESIRVQNRALADVQRYCPAALHEQLR